MIDYEFDKVLQDTSKEDLIRLFHSAYQVAFEQCLNASSACEIIKESFKKDLTKNSETIDNLVIDMIDKEVNKNKDNLERLTGCHDFIFTRINEWYKALYIDKNEGEDK